MRFKLLEMLILMDILLNRSINDALVAEEKFFRSRPVYNGLADRCGVPQLAKKLNQEVDPCEGLTDDDIRTAIQRSSSIYTWLIRFLWMVRIGGGVFPDMKVSHYKVIPL
ncbi:uncharacterized protein [Gossypium hirsutum]|uniref:Uncharacterized protein isoform X2 n=1 Tax=Gossypium hirsutum TaxID=3635 RepID=A0ABM2YJF6_GOSHI|nr:uncharacterized protein LOC107951512 isoform X2 [Gossypium hirsutum]